MVCVVDGGWELRRLCWSGMGEVRTRTRMDEVQWCSHGGGLLRVRVRARRGGGAVRVRVPVGHVLTKRLAQKRVSAGPGQACCVKSCCSGSVVLTQSGLWRE